MDELYIPVIVMLCLFTEIRMLIKHINIKNGSRLKLIQNYWVLIVEINISSKMVEEM